MFVIFTDRAQYVGCEFCGKCQGPRDLVPAIVFLAWAKEFFREHRACEVKGTPTGEWPPAARVPLGASHSFPARHRMPWEGERQPGEDG